MGEQIIKQPNGMYCIYSSVTGMIEAWNLNVANIIYQFTETFEDVMKESKRRMNPERYEKLLKEIVKTKVP
jgi:translation initiation factor IF-2